MVAAAAIPYFVGLQRSTIWDANEAFYAETAREMIESGDYVSPSFNYQPRFNKPVLSYWVIAGSYRLFGISERSERLPIAAAAAVLMVTAYFLARAGGGVDAGPFAVLALATTPRFLMMSRRIIIDMWLTMFMGLTLLWFVLAETQPLRRRLYLFLMYVAAGLGALTKGPVAVVLPALAILVFLASERRLHDLRRMMIPFGALTVLAIVVPWYAAIYAQHGSAFIRQFFIDENVVRYTQPVGLAQRGPLFYFPVLLSDLFPWSLLLPVALLATFGAVRNPLRAMDDASRVRRLLVIWIATIVVFFTFSRTKEDLYIFPAVSAEAALIGIILGYAVHGRTEFSVAIRWSFVVIGAMVAVIGVALLAISVSTSSYQLAGAQAVAFLALLGGTLVGWCSGWQRRFDRSLLGLACTFATMSWVFVLVTLPDFERFKPVAPLVKLIAHRAASDALIGYYRFAVPSMVFYARRPVIDFDEARLKEAFASGTEVHCLMTAADYEAVKDRLAQPIYVVARRPFFDVRLRSLIAGTAMPEILLVSNKP